MSEHTVEGPTIKRLERSRSDRMLAGVCGGLASYFEIHPAFFRVGFVVLTLLGGAGIVIYLAAALVMPDEGKEDSVVSAALRNRRDRPWPLIGLALLALAGVILLSHATLWPGGDAWIVLLIAGAAILWITRQGKAEATTDAKQLATRDSRRIRRFFVALAVALASLVALVLVAAAIFAAVVHVHVGRGVGERTYNVAGIQDLRENYRLGVGKMVLDLSDVQFPADQETQVNARVDVGRLDVIVPPDVALRVHGDTQFGDVNLLGDVSGGHDVERSVDQDGKRVLVLDAHVGAGALRVNRAVR
jgi:phage shock protein PspC (stress-responsive transcriptional regulator)/predicted membrane protein